MAPPPLPMKNRDSESGNLFDESQYSTVKAILSSERCYQAVNLNPKMVSNVHYETLEIRSRDFISNETKTGKKSQNPPTPPPKPARHSKGSALQ